MRRFIVKPKNPNQRSIVFNIRCRVPLRHLLVMRTLDICSFFLIRPNFDFRPCFGSCRRIQLAPHVCARKIRVSGNVQHTKTCSQESQACSHSWVFSTDIRHTILGMSLHFFARTHTSRVFNTMSKKFIEDQLRIERKRAKRYSDGASKAVVAQRTGCSKCRGCVKLDFVINMCDESTQMCMYGGMSVCVCVSIYIDKCVGKDYYIFRP